MSIKIHKIWKYRPRNFQKLLFNNGCLKHCFFFCCVETWLYTVVNANTVPFNFFLVKSIFVANNFALYKSFTYLILICDSEFELRQINVNWKVHTSDSFCLSFRLAMNEASSGIDSGAFTFFTGFLKFPSSLWFPAGGSWVGCWVPCAGDFCEGFLLYKNNGTTVQRVR